MGATDKKAKKKVKRKKDKSEKELHEEADINADNACKSDAKREEPTDTLDPERKLKKRKKSKKEDGSTVKKSRLEKKKELMEKIPETNEFGLPFTKIQIRKMVKRVKSGLPPIPSKQEQKELEKQRKQEDKEISEMLFSREDKGGTKNDDENEAETDNEDVEEEREEKESLEVKNDTSGEEGVTEASKEKTVGIIRSKKSRTKPVPDDYVCFACKNKLSPKHWIYDCPSKVTVRGTNKVKKNQRGVTQPGENKIFVSGFPYNVKRKDICEYFERKSGKVVACKMMTFQDSLRFNGQVILSFDTKEFAEKALKLDGEIYRGSDDQQKKGNETEKERWLKVTRVLSRAVTKKSSKNGKKKRNRQ